MASAHKQRFYELAVSVQPDEEAVCVLLRTFTVRLLLPGGSNAAQFGPLPILGIPPTPPAAVVDKACCKVKPLDTGCCMPCVGRCWRKLSPGTGFKAVKGASVTVCDTMSDFLRLELCPACDPGMHTASDRYGAADKMGFSEQSPCASEHINRRAEAWRSRGRS